jgi:hypothetical protein
MVKTGILQAHDLNHDFVIPTSTWTVVDQSCGSKPETVKYGKVRIMSLPTPLPMSLPSSPPFTLVWFGLG